MLVSSSKVNMGDVHDSDLGLKVRDLEIHNEVLKREAQKLKEQLEDAERQEAKLVAESRVSSSIANDKVMELTRAQEEWERKCHKATEELTRAEAALLNERESVAALQKEVRNLRLDAQVHAQDQGDIERREEAIAKQTEEVERLRKRVTELETISKELADEVKLKNIELAEVAAALADKDGDLADTKRRVHELEEDNEELRDELLSATQPTTSQPEPTKPQALGLSFNLNLGGMDHNRNGGDAMVTARTARPLGQLPTASLYQNDTPRREAGSTRDPYSEPLLQEDDTHRFGPVLEDRGMQTIAPFEYSDREDDPHRKESACPCVIC